MPDPVSSVVTSGDSTLATTTVSFSAQTAGTILTLHVASDDYKTGNPSGWTVVEEVGSAEGSFHASYWWSKVCTGSETSVAYTIGSAAKSSYLLMVHTNIDNTTPKDVSAKQNTNTSLASYTTPASPTTSSGRKYGLAHVSGHGTVDTYTSIGTWLNSYVEQGERLAAGSSPFYAMGVAGLAFDGGGTTSSGATFSHIAISRVGMIGVFNVYTDSGAVFPTIPTSGASRILSSANTSPAGTHTFPTLSSLTKNAGDLLIAICITYDGNSTNAEFSSWGGGFTEFVDQATTATMGIGCAYKFSTGSETGTFTVTTADTSTNDSVCLLLSIAGAHATTPPEGGTIANGTGAAADPASFNPTGWDVEKTLWIAVCGAGEDSTTGTFTAPSAAPTNYGSLFATAVTADVVGGVYGAVAFRQSEAASDDAGGFTVDITQARNSALVLAVRPAAVAIPELPILVMGPRM